MPNTNFQTIFQMGQAINDMVKQATGRDVVQTIEMGQVTVAQNHMEVSGSASGNPAVFVTHESVPLQIMAPFNPVQDLHGYDAPWPAGGGKNLLPMTVEGIKACNTSGTWTGNSYLVNGITYTILTDNGSNVSGIKVNGTSNANVYLNLFNGTITIESGAYSSLVSDEVHDVNLQLRIGSVSGSDVMGSTTSSKKQNTINESTDIIGRLSIASSKTISNITVYPMLAKQSEELSEATYEPYSNICPITGWTGVEIYQAGDNLVYDSLANANIDGTGEIFVLPSNTSSLCFALVTEGVTYAINRSATTLVAYFSDAPGDGSRAYDRTTHYINGTFTAPITGYVAVRVPADEVATFQLYQQNTYTVVFPDEAGTVYGGTLTVNTDGTGSLAVDRANVDLGTLSWTYSTTTNHEKFDAPIVGAKAYSDVTAVANAKCSIYKTDSFTHVYSHYEKNICAVTDSAKISVYDPAYSDASTFATAMSGVQLVYELATPITYTLSAPVIRSLIGTNNVSANTGAVTVNYTDIVEGGGN